MKIYGKPLRRKKSVWIAIVAISFFIAWVLASGTSHAGTLADPLVFGKSKNANGVGD